jgi:hypothetical protein
MQTRDLALNFESVFQRSLFLEKVALDTPEVSFMFEVIATNLLVGAPEREHHYFDGAIGLTSKVRASRTVEFQGEMWVGDENNQWTEPLKVTVTERNEKGSSKRRAWITISVGADHATGELFSAFGAGPEAEPSSRANSHQPPR